MLEYAYTSVPSSTVFVRGLSMLILTALVCWLFNGFILLPNATHSHLMNSLFTSFSITKNVRINFLIVLPCAFIEEYFSRAQTRRRVSRCLCMLWPYRFCKTPLLGNVSIGAPTSSVRVWGSPHLCQHIVFSSFLTSAYLMSMEWYNLHLV